MEGNLIRLTSGGFDATAVFTGGFNLWAVLGILLGVAAVGGLAYRVRFWWKEGRKLVSEPGHITPRAPVFARIFRLIGTRLYRWRYIGPFKQLGSEHLKDPRRLIILINHQTERDVIIVPSTLRLRVARSLMAVSQITGIRIPLAAWGGVVAVHHDRNPAAALRGMIKVMQADEDSDGIVFPQGALIRNNVLVRKEFFDGAMMIGKKTAEKSKRPVAYLPAAISYDRNPAHASLAQRFFEWLGWKNFRNFYGEVIYGASIAFGEPVPVDSLPDDHHASMDIIFGKIQALSAQADAALKRPTDKAPEAKTA